MRRGLAFTAAWVTLATVGLSVSQSTAAPLPKEMPAPISSENVAQLRSIKEMERTVSRIIRAPKPGELILSDWNSQAELVDDKLFNSLRVLPKDRKTDNVILSPDSKVVAWTDKNSKVYTVQDLDSGKSFDIDVGEKPDRAAFSPDGKLIAIGSSYWDPNAHGVGHSETHIYDSKGKHLRTIERTGPGHVQPIFSPDGKTLAIGNRNYETLLVDVESGKVLHKLDKKMTQEVNFSPDGKKLAAGYVDGNVGVWDVATGKQLHMEATDCKEIYSVDFSPKGDLLVSAGRQGKIIFWDPVTFKRIREMDAPFWVIQARFSADGTRMFTSSASDYGRLDRKITVWAVAKEGDK